MNRTEHSPPERDSSSCWRGRGTGWLSKGGQLEGEVARVDNRGHVYIHNRKQKGRNYIRLRGGKNDRSTERHGWGHGQALFREISWVRGTMDPSRRHFASVVPASGVPGMQGSLIRPSLDFTQHGI